MAEEALRDLVQIIGEDVTPFVFTPARGNSATPINGTRSSLDQSDTLTDEGGFMPGYQFSVTAVFLDFPTPPKNGDRIDVDNVPYRIVRVLLDDFKIGVRCDLATDK